MSIYLGNAFSLQMLDPDISNTIQVDPVDLNEVAKADFISVVGHADTAIILSRILGRKVVMNRASNRLTKDDVYYVAQVVGGRLPEGTTVLPEGKKMRFFKVTLI